MENVEIACVLNHYADLLEILQVARRLQRRPCRFVPLRSDLFQFESGLCI
jgi:hypothetical protein